MRLRHRQRQHGIGGERHIDIKPGGAEQVG
jgi:hypothetical protein